jgi:hypothetical protein
MTNDDCIRKILIELTDALGYTGTQKQVEAFIKAQRDLEDLIEMIDNAERL